MGDRTLAHGRAVERDAVDGEHHITDAQQPPWPRPTGATRGCRASTRVYVDEFVEIVKGEPEAVSVARHRHRQLHRQSFGSFGSSGRSCWRSGGGGGGRTGGRAERRAGRRAGRRRRLQPAPVCRGRVGEVPVEIVGRSWGDRGEMMGR